LREEQRPRVFENRVLMKIFGRERGEVTGEWRRLQNEELYDLYSTTNIIRMSKQRTTKWRGQVAVWGRGEVYTGFWLGVPRERDHLEDPGIDGRVPKCICWLFIYFGLKWIFKNWDGGMN
jgi:hypothetical protein